MLGVTVVGAQAAGKWRGGAPKDKGGVVGIKKMQTMNPSKLKPTHMPTKSKKQFAALVEDIRINGIRESIKYVKYNGKNYIVDGHHRLWAAKQLGIQQVPVERVELPFAGYKNTNDLLDFDWGY